MVLSTLDNSGLLRLKNSHVFVLTSYVTNIDILLQKLVKSEAPEVPNPLDLVTGKERAASVIFKRESEEEELCLKNVSNRIFNSSRNIQCLSSSSFFSTDFDRKSVDVRQVQ